MVAATLSTQCTLWKNGSQEVQACFDGPTLVSDAGLIAVRALDRNLGFLQDLAQRLPDPRSQPFVRHSKESIVTQLCYQFLAGYIDNNDADTLRDDPLMQVLADLNPHHEETVLASRSTLNRFQYSFTRREQVDLDDPDPLAEQLHSQCQRIKIINQYLLDWFAKTQCPSEIILDFDATDDPVHGQQTLSGYHGYYQQHQYFPLLVFDGESGFPLAAWLRPGTVGAACGALQVLQQIVEHIRHHWPEVPIRLRADSGFGNPEIYAFCEEHGIEYAIGYGSNSVLLRRTECAASDIETLYAFYGHREPVMQRFESISDYQAGSWDRPRRIIAKIERTPIGSQRRFVVTNMSEHAEWIYRDFYVKRGAVPEQCLDELKNGMTADRLSSHGFRANSFRFLIHVVGYALVILFRQACVSIPEVSNKSIGCLRQRFWNIPAVVIIRNRRVCFQFSSDWADAELFRRILDCCLEYGENLRRWEEVSMEIMNFPRLF
jgi:hypothetical protein